MTIRGKSKAGSEGVRNDRKAGWGGGGWCDVIR